MIPNKSRTDPESLLKSNMSGNLKFLEINIFEMLESTGPNIPDDPFKKLLNMLNMGWISSRKHEMGIW